VGVGFPIEPTAAGDGTVCGATRYSGRCKKPPPRYGPQVAATTPCASKRLVGRAAADDRRSRRNKTGARATQCRVTRCVSGTSRLKQFDSRGVHGRGRSASGMKLLRANAGWFTGWFSRSRQMREPADGCGVRQHREIYRHADAKRLGPLQNRDAADQVPRQSTRHRLPGQRKPQQRQRDPARHRALIPSTKWGLRAVDKVGARHPRSRREQTRQIASRQHPAVPEHARYRRRFADRRSQCRPTRVRLEHVGAARYSRMGPCGGDAQRRV